MKKTARSTLPPVRFDRSNGPLHRQACDFLRGAIATGELPPGAPLPSTRSLARLWRVSRNTVLCVYETLAADGLVEGRIGSGTRVRGGVNRAKPTYATGPSLRSILRDAHYPAHAAFFCDPDGHPVYIHR